MSGKSPAIRDAETGGKRENERGQVLPFVAVGLMGAALIAALVARSAITLFERERAQTAADAAALAGATGIARGLNVAAVSNQYLMSVGLLQAVLMLAGSAAAVDADTLRKTIIRFQDRWLDRGSQLMEGTAGAVADSNGMDAVLIWNERGITPSLNLARMGAAGDSQGSGSGKREKGRYSYRKRGGGRVEVPEEEVETVTFKRGGKQYTQYRKQGKEGGKAGRFLKKEKAGKAGGTAGVEILMFAPLTEIEPIHTVLVIGRMRESPACGTLAPLARGGQFAASKAEAWGGGILGSKSHDDPNWDARLVPMEAAAAGLTEVLGGAFGDAGSNEWEPPSQEVSAEGR